MDIDFLKTVLTAPGDHPRWETDLLAKLTDVPSHELIGTPIAAALGPDERPLLVTPSQA